MTHDDYGIASQDYVEMLEKLPKAKLFDLFQKRYSRSIFVKNSLSLSLSRRLF